MELDKPLTFDFGVRSGPANIIKFTEGWDLWKDALQLDAEFWPFSWLGLRGGTGLEHTSGTEAVLGSRRWLGHLELAPRLRIPLLLLDHIYVSPSVRGRFGKSELNFGGGDVPEAATDYLWDYGGRGGIFMAITEDVGVDIFAGFENGHSAARDYREESYFAGASLMLGWLPSFRKIFGE